MRSPSRNRSLKQLRGLNKSSETDLTKAFAELASQTRWLGCHVVPAMMYPSQCTPPAATHFVSTPSKEVRHFAPSLQFQALRESFQTRNLWWGDQKIGVAPQHPLSEMERPAERGSFFTHCKARLLWPQRGSLGHFRDRFLRLLSHPCTNAKGFQKIIL